MKLYLIASIFISSITFQFALANPVAVSGEGINFSTRVEIVTKPVISGIVVSGEKVVLIRAVGPGLKPFGVTSTLADPLIYLHDSHGKLRYWSVRMSDLNESQKSIVAKAFTDAGAFPLSSNSADAVLVVPLSGNHTMTVRDTYQKSGEVLIESYILPWHEFDRNSFIGVSSPESLIDD